MSVSPVPVWHQSSWDGPVVELRPEDAGPEWPESAVERVVFRVEDFPRRAGSLPYTEYYSADGWPVHCPPHVRPDLDPRMPAELHRFPWTAVPSEWDEFVWRRDCGSYDDFQRWNGQAAYVRKAVPRGDLPTL